MRLSTQCPSQGQGQSKALASQEGSDRNKQTAVLIISGVRSGRIFGVMFSFPAAEFFGNWFDGLWEVTR